jgi:hypothetical protein
VRKLPNTRPKGIATASRIAVSKAASV